MNNLSLIKKLLSISILAVTVQVNASEPLTEIVVTAELLTNNLLQLPNSISVIDHTAIERRSAQHIEELLNLAPNVNFASGASRGRFIQIRGIGERSEFQEPIINSVGVLLDGIDMTGIATAASMLDIKQVEILRGPQGTLFGANALAGLINLVSNSPSSDFYARLNTAIEDNGGFAYSGVVSAPANDDSAFRLAIKHYQSDGFINNIFLARDDTNNINETTARARYFTQINDALKLDFTLLVADIDNGYDTFSLDNTRLTYSDQPGADRQDTVAGSVKVNYSLNETLTVETLLSHADSKLEYSYDEDWGHDGICRNTACDSDLFGFDWFYSSFDSYFRDNKNTSIDLKLISDVEQRTSWLLGVYKRDQSIVLDRVYTFAESDFTSNLNTKNSAIYGQLDQTLSDHWSFITGLRIEQRELNYLDSNLATANTDEDLWGGRIALEYSADSGAFYYALISRGYKPGGVNLDGSLSAEQRNFKTETMINYEFGYKNSLLNDEIHIQAALFYQDRKNIQTKQSIVTSIENGELGGLCPCSFTDFTDNASGGKNYGVEFEFNWRTNDKFKLFASLGLLKTEFDNLLSFDHIGADRDNGVPFNLKGREQAHAPSYQWMLGSEYMITDDLTISGSLEGKDEFFFSDRHDERSDAYELLNLELTYQLVNWQVALYGKNLTNELVKTRGFGSFGNDPRKFYTTEPYNQFAAPRLVGIKASLEF